jgi:hypothetical protein
MPIQNATISVVTELNIGDSGVSICGKSTRRSVEVEVNCLCATFRAAILESGILHGQPIALLIASAPFALTEASGVSKKNGPVL